LIQPEGLTDALGAVREGVACIENLAQLLGSRRVGPRQLPHALPEVQAGCATLVSSLSALEVAMADQLANDQEGLAGLRTMLAYASTQVSELHATLEGREAKGAIDTKERLRLEGAVVRVAGELNTLLRVVDLVGAAARSKTTAIDLGDMLEQRRPLRRSPLTPVLAVMELWTTPMLVADARVVLELLEFAVATVVRAGVDSPRIVVERGADEAMVITVAELVGELKVEPGATPHVIDVARRAGLPEEGTVIRAAARKVGISVEMREGGRSVVIKI